VADAPLIDAEILFRQPEPALYQKDLPIIIVAIILFGTLSVLMGLWQAPVPILISAL